MLKIKTKRILLSGTRIASLIAILVLIGGAYMLTLVMAPTIAPITSMKPINVSTLPAPTKADNRIVIPKIGVNITYSEGQTALDHGAEWRYPERGNPETGGNFIIAAHRFSIQPTPQSTIEKSPFYNLSKMVTGDKIVVDYNGTRYGYEITDVTTTPPSQAAIEAASTESKLTIYNSELDRSSTGNTVLVAKSLGKVALLK